MLGTDRFVLVASTYVLSSVIAITHVCREIIGETNIIIMVRVQPISYTFQLCTREFEQI